MDISEIRALSDADLAAQLVDAKQELWKIRFDLATRQEKNYSRLPATRKRIARILTVMTERQHAADASSHGAAADEPAPVATAAETRKAAS
jgi:large subunit ribosomal protein L29